MSKTGGDSSEIQIEYVPMGEIRRWPRNPKLHDLDSLGRSVEKFGFTQPILVDASTGQVVAGHGRLETLQALRAVGRPPPARVREASGDWLVPVVRVPFSSEEAARAYVVADNKIQEGGGWESSLLAEMVQSLPADLAECVGLSSKEMEEITSFSRSLEAREFDVNESPDGRVEVATCPSCGRPL